jgi:hypothetical protein
MAKLTNKSKVYGSLTVDNNIIAKAGAGYQNIVAFTAVSSSTFVFPASLQIPGVKFKLTILGAGGGGGGATAIGAYGGGGGAGGLIIINLTVVYNLYSLSYVVGGFGGGAASNATAAASGTLSSVTYNGITYTATGGGGCPIYSATTGIFGVGGTFSGITNGTTPNAIGINGGVGVRGGPGIATATFLGYGADSPLGFGQGGRTYDAATTGGNGNAATGYGAGGGGGYCGSAATARGGGNGSSGLIIIEY